MKTILEQLVIKNVQKLTNQEVSELEGQLKQEKSFETGITGPIKVFNLLEEGKKLVLEVDQKGNNYIRIVEGQNIQEFVDERLSIYDKMWDGCGCKVFYDEEWIPVKGKNIEL